MLLRRAAAASRLALRATAGRLVPLAAVGDAGRGGRGTGGSAAAAAAAAAVAAAAAATTALCSGHSEPLETPLAAVPLELVADLREAVGQDHVLLDADEREARGKPWNSYHKIDNFPGVVVLPSSTDEVAAIVRACKRHNVPLVAVGGGTSLEGHTLALSGGVSLDMSRMEAIVALHTRDLDVVVQPGLGYLDLNEKLKPHGLWFPLDPGPGASIGGMCACRCSGSTAVRYGTMRDNVLALTAVLSDGTVVHTGTRARKSAAGYDLTRLLVGSEGTLAVITEVTLRLHRIPPKAAAVRVAFPSITAAADAARETLVRGLQGVQRCELMDDVMVKVSNSANNRADAEAPTLLYEIVGPSDASVLEELEAVRSIVQEYGGTGVRVATDPAECKELWRARKEALWAANAAFPDCECMITDVCVPLSALPELIGATKKEIEASGLNCPIVSHAGDGNFHVLIHFRADVKEEVEEAHRLSDFMVNKAQALGGTCTGEHGVGVGKVQYLERELGLPAVSVMATIKHSLDPNGVLNPGKVLAHEVDPSTGRLRLKRARLPCA
eukprot:CAMPEP_0198419704 /NCGR_PEP_ID=MMETSP1452-20131203/394_1 /TAXON_ID=1181717 /ORGANISM="Synchroma pusillum, Strain CCMP3072" /LENGTH=554 /DNA_ID=CAMNT_0044139841 /DNA_START=1 /DNA_END=1665 /DNA_ORIENTATION=-